MLKIAITGNIASGKTQVEKIISQHFPVYDTDKMCHKLLDEITDFYNFDVFTNGNIDRKKLGKLVFENPDLRKKLEDIIHPKIKQEILNLFKSDKKIIFISIPLLFEAGFESMFDKIIFVESNEEIRLSRLMSRNGLSKQEAILRIKSQNPQEQKIKKSDYIIHNNSSMENLNQQVLILIRELSRLI